MGFHTPKQWGNMPTTYIQYTKMYNFINKIYVTEENFWNTSKYFITLGSEWRKKHLRESSVVLGWGKSLGYS